MIENKNLVSDDAEVASCLNNFFSNIVKNLVILRYEVDDDFHLNMNSDPTLKVVFKYKNYPSIISIKHFCQNSHLLSNEPISLLFSKINQESIKQTTDLSASYL